MLLGLALASVLIAQPRPEVFYAYGRYDASIPRPSKILGYEIGDRHTTYFGQQRVVEAICAAAKNRTRYIEYGRSNEGRPLRIIAISSPENIARLDQIRAANQKLADGTADANVIANNPTIVWINETIHGNEAASFESGMQLLYNLVASQNPAITDFLKNTVVILNPCYNTDGHERYVVWQNSIAVGSPDPGAIEHTESRINNGRTNHYRFDMNRDRVSLSQIETQQEVAEMLKWNPQTYVDQHGEVETYFFPPTAMSNHAFMDRARYTKWTEIYGRATAKAFDKNGWGYFIKDTFDMYYPGYLDNFATMSGAIGMTHETDAAEIARTDSDGVQRTLWGGAAKHFTSALAVIRAASEHRRELLQSYADFKADAVKGKNIGANRYMVAYSKEKLKIERLAENLRRAGIKTETGHGHVSTEGESLWKDSGKFEGDGWWLTLDLAQPQGVLARALCSTEPGFEEEFIKEQLRRKDEGEGSEFYDLTGWSLPLLHDVKAWWQKTEPKPTTTAVSTGKTAMGEIGYAIAPGEGSSLLALRLLARGIRISFSDREMLLAGQKFEPGTFLVLKGRQEEGFEKVVEELDTEGLRRPLPTGYPDATRYGPGSEGVNRLRKSSVAVVFGDEQNATPFGYLWFALEKQLFIPFTPVTRNGLRGKLDRFSVIIAPGGRIESSDALKAWVNEGGCLILAGGSPSTGGFIDLKSNTITPIPGGVAKATIDSKSWLGYGSEDSTIAVPVEGVYEANDDTAVRLVDAPNMLHGWAWPGETEKQISGTAFAQVANSGNGHVVWFAQDPTDRAMWPGLNLLLLNAMVYGPRS